MTFFPLWILKPYRRASLSPRSFSFVRRNEVHRGLRHRRRRRAARRRRPDAGHEPKPFAFAFVRLTKSAKSEYALVEVLVAVFVARRAFFFTFDFVFWISRNRRDAHGVHGFAHRRRGGREHFAVRRVVVRVVVVRHNVRVGVRDVGYGHGVRFDRDRPGTRGRRRRRRGMTRRRRKREVREVSFREKCCISVVAFDGGLGETRRPRRGRRRRGRQRVRRGERAAPSERARRRNVAGRPTVHAAPPLLAVVAGGADGTSRRTRISWRLRVRTRVLAARTRACLSTGRRLVQDAPGRVDAVRGRLGRATRPAPHARGAVRVVLTFAVGVFLQVATWRATELSRKKTIVPKAERRATVPVIRTQTSHSID